MQSDILNRELIVQQLRYANNNCHSHSNEHSAVRPRFQCFISFRYLQNQHRIYTKTSSTVITSTTTTTSVGTTTTTHAITVLSTVVTYVSTTTSTNTDLTSTGKFISITHIPAIIRNALSLIPPFLETKICTIYNTCPTWTGPPVGPWTNSWTGTGPSGGWKPPSITPTNISTTTVD
jgi:hypothetical protein